MDIEIGAGKSARRAYGLDEVSIVPSRRTRDPDDVDISWNLDAWRFGLPLMGSAMDAVVSPSTAIEIGKLGGLAVLNLEGLWCRYEDPEAVYSRIAEATPSEATKVIQDIYTEPLKGELMRDRIREIKAAGVTVAASLTPQTVATYAKFVLEGELDILVIQGTVVSAEHVSQTREPLNLKEFIRNFDLPVIVGGCASYATAYHLMKTGAVGVLVGVGPGAACTSRQVLGIGVPQATAVADAAGARTRHLEETGRYCHVIADGGMRTGGDISKAIACGADAVMIASPLAAAFEAPGRGFHWGMATFHPELPRGVRVQAGQNATLKEILVGPADVNDGTLNLFGALRFSMATSGYGTIREFQKAEVAVAPAVKSEGKLLQHSQGVGSIYGPLSTPATAQTLDPVLVLDFGAQYAQLIARRVRECHVYSEIVSHSITSEEVLRRKPKGIILSGGPASVYEPGAPDCDDRIFGLGIPVLGICYGQQVMAQALGGEVGHTEVGEYGKVDLDITERESVVLSGLPEKTTAWMSHRDGVVKPPPGFDVIASTPACPVAAMEDPIGGLYAVQFHPEVVHTPHGMEVMRNFLYKGCEIAPTWTPVSIIDEAIDSIRKQVGKKQVVCALSGGVDSSVAALLVHRAVGDQLICIYVDHGLMREGESEQVVATFRKHFNVELIHVDAREKFLDALAGVTDPERKRKIIGELFIRTFEEVAKGVGGSGFLVQGTLYPDVIESGGDSSGASTIKSHHNVGGLPDWMDFELVEPLRNLFKDEVRTVGEELGLPAEIVQRQPFPGPGLAVRIIGDITQERLEIVRKADHIVRDELHKAGLEREIWQSYAALIGVQSVGVQGDERTYAYPIVVRAVTSEDAMTADWAKIPHEVLDKISSRITAEVRGVNRVVYDITSKPPGTIEWE